MDRMYSHLEGFCRFIEMVLQHANVEILKVLLEIINTLVTRSGSELGSAHLSHFIPQLIRRFSKEHVC